MTTAIDRSHLSAADIDIYSLDKYEKTGVPHEELSWLRQNAPVFFHPEPDGRGFWAVTKHEDIRRISSDPETFSSAVGGTNIRDYPAEDLANIQMMIVNIDPPRHAEFRKLIRSRFTPKMVGRLQKTIEDRAKRIVDQIAKKGECEFVTSVAAELPLQVIADLVGIPEEDQPRIFDWTNKLLGFDDPEFSDLTMEETRAAAAEVWAYADGLADTREGSDGEDLVSVLLRSEIEGRRLTRMEFDAFFLMLSLAGNETTRTAISQSLLTLIEHPDARRRLTDDLSLMPSAVEEILRWVAPVMHFRRTATRDVEIRGQQIKEGEKVVVFYHGGNRDENVFDNPDRFDICRSPNDHLSFGHGEHYCLGAHLARLEVTVMLKELLSRLPDIELVRPVRRLRSNFINGIKEMHIRFTPES